MAVRIKKYDQAFRSIGLPFNSKAELIVKMLEREGRSEGSICFAIWKEQELLIQHRGQEDFWKVFGEAVKKWSWAKDDPRWIEWKKKKEAQERAKETQRELTKKRTFKKQYDKEELPGFIYFIQGECGGPIKIGYSTDLATRLTSLQTGYPDRLELLFAMPGKPEYEKAIHKQFAEYRLNGEWFRPTKEVIERIRYFRLLNEHVALGDIDLMRIGSVW